MTYRRPNFNEPIEGEICGMPMEAYAITVQLLFEDDCISIREFRQIASYVEMPAHSPQFRLELPKLIHAICLRWQERERAKERARNQDDEDMAMLVETLRKTTDEEIRRAIS